MTKLKVKVKCSLFQFNYGVTHDALTCALTSLFHSQDLNLVNMPSELPLRGSGMNFRPISESINTATFKKYLKTFLFCNKHYGTILEQ